MNKLLGVPLLLVTLLGIYACSKDQPQVAVPQEAAVDTADAVFVNGQVFTVDDALPSAEAFAISDGKFVAVGSDEEERALVGDNTVVTDLEKQFVTPGFIDTHFHSVAASILTAEFDTGDLPDNESMYERLREFAEANEGRTEPLVT